MGKPRIASEGSVQRPTSSLGVFFSFTLCLIDLWEVTAANLSRRTRFDQIIVRANAQGVHHTLEHRMARQHDGDGVQPAALKLAQQVKTVYPSESADR